MSGLTKSECELLVAEGWQLIKGSDRPEFFMDLGRRQIKMCPTTKGRRSKVMDFYSEARRYDSEYGAVAKAVGWGGAKFFPGRNSAPAMSKFQIDEFDAAFAYELTLILKEYALNADPKQLIADSIERRTKVRCSLAKADLIDYAYLRRTEDLENISVEERDDGAEFISPKEDVECLRKAIEVSRRPIVMSSDHSAGSGST